MSFQEICSLHKQCYTSCSESINLTTCFHIQKGKRVSELMDIEIESISAGKVNFINHNKYSTAAVRQSTKLAGVIVSWLPVCCLSSGGSVPIDAHKEILVSCSQPLTPAGEGLAARDWGNLQLLCHCWWCYVQESDPSAFWWWIIHKLNLFCCQYIQSMPQYLNFVKCQWRARFIAAY